MAQEGTFNPAIILQDLIRRFRDRPGIRDVLKEYAQQQEGLSFSERLKPDESLQGLALSFMPGSLGLVGSTRKIGLGLSNKTPRTIDDIRRVLDVVIEKYPQYTDKLSESLDFLASKTERGVLGLSGQPGSIGAIRAAIRRAVRDDEIADKIIADVGLGW